MSKQPKDIDQMGDMELADELTLTVGRSLVKIFREGLVVQNDGETVNVSPTAAYLNAARQYIQTVHHITPEDPEKDPFDEVQKRMNGTTEKDN